MKHSETLTKLAPALAKVQAAIKPAVKDSTNPHFKSKYADLSSVWEAVRDTLGKNGLSVLQGYGTEPTPHVWTMLLHESGEWVQGECPLILGKQDPQGVGAATTYYRRYGLAAILGVTQEDDDAEGAMNRAPRHESKPAVPDLALDDWAVKLEEAATLEELAATWAKVPSYHQGPLTKMKDNLKRKLNGGK